MKTVVLVYSGGLDTSVCIPLLKKEYGYEHIATVTIDVGQCQQDLEQAKSKAKILGTEQFTIDAKEEFAKDFCFQALRANGEYQGYPLSTAIARPLIAKKAVEIAQTLGTIHFAHGCTGKGNDQFRIEFMIRALCPEAVIYAPIRERNITRHWSIEYARKNGIPIEQTGEKIWSIDENLWGRSIEGGKLEDPSYYPPEEIFSWTKHETLLSGRTDLAHEIKLNFEQGELSAINGEKASPATLIIQLNKLAGEWGVGRLDLMEDRLLGLKARENYECPAAVVLLRAHKALESLVLTKEELQFKSMVDTQWSSLAYHGLWLDPLKEDLDAFIAKTQIRVSGEVYLRFKPGSFSVIGRKSPWALYSKELTSFDSDSGWDQNDSSGMVKNFGIQSRMYLHLGKELALKRGERRA